MRPLAKDTFPRERFHALDSLRAGMMIFGVVLHAGLIYGNMPPNGVWVIKDRDSIAVCDWVQSFSGSFRMQVFFFLSGFFGAMILARRGAIAFLGNRARRLVPAFLIAWPVGFTAVRAAFVYSLFPEDEPWLRVWNSAASGRLWNHPYPIHIWFLEYLLIYCFVAAFVTPFLAQLPRVLRKVGAHAYRSVIAHPAGVVVLAFCTAPCLLLSLDGTFEIPLSFEPAWSSLAAYGVFFAVGWFLYANRDLLAGLAGQGSWYLLLVAAFVSGDWLLCHELVRPFETSPTARVGARADAGARGEAEARVAAVGLGVRPRAAEEVESRTGRGRGGRAEAVLISSRRAAQRDGVSVMPEASEGRGDSRGRVVGEPACDEGAWGWLEGVFSPWVSGMTRERAARTVRSALFSWLMVLGHTGVAVRYLDRSMPIIRYLTDASYWIYLAHFPVVAWVGIGLAGWELPAIVKLGVNVALTLFALLAVYELLVRRSRLGRLFFGKVATPPPFRGRKEAARRIIDGSCERAV
jgi:peptidoglycan/LPS O-acetylase OafA/YrhL